MTALSLRRVLTVPLLLAAPALAAAAPAHAAGPPVTVSVQRAAGAPSTFFSQPASPGRTTRAGVLVVRNLTSRAVAVRLAPVNALTTDTLGSAYGAVGAAPRRATSWTRISQTSLRLAPGERRGVDIAVRVPAGTAAGDYLAGISVFTPGHDEPTAARGGLMIGEEYRYAVGVETRVPGARAPHVRFTGAHLGRQPSAPVTIIRARNDGNATLKNVRGWAVISRGTRTVAREPIGPGTFVAGTAIGFPVRMPGEQPRAGTTYRVRAKLDYGPRAATLDTMVRFGKAAAAVQQQYARPATKTSTGSGGNRTWQLATLLAAAAALLALLLVAWRRRHLPGPAGTRRLLARELAALAAGGPPLSVVRVRPVSGHRAARRAVVALRPHVPPAVRVGRLDGMSLLLVLPRTGAEFAAALEEELRRALHDVLPGAPVQLTSATAANPVGVDALLVRLDGLDASSGATSNPDAHDGDVPHDHSAAA